MSHILFHKVNHIVKQKKNRNWYYRMKTSTTFWVQCKTVMKVNRNEKQLIASLITECIRNTCIRAECRQFIFYQTDKINTTLITWNLL